MQKLKLELEALEVSSFETDAAAEERGTVHAQSHNTEFCTQEYSCQIPTYACSDWRGCPTGGYDVCPIYPPNGPSDVPV